MVKRVDHCSEWAFSLSRVNRNTGQGRFSCSLHCYALCCSHASRSRADYDLNDSDCTERKEESFLFGFPTCICLVRLFQLQMRMPRTRSMLACA